MTTHTAETPADALARIRSARPNGNDSLVMTAFAARGIPPAEIDPRENVLTFNAWKALDRHVRRGERSVHLRTWIPVPEKRNNAGEITRKAGSRPKVTFVFHVSQTEPNRNAAA